MEGDLLAAAVSPLPLRINFQTRTSIDRSLDLAISGVSVRMRLPWLIIQHNTFCIEYLDFAFLKVT